MSDEEKLLVETQGKFARAVRNGQQSDDVTWIDGRILLSNERLGLVSEGGKRTIPLSAVTDVGNDSDVGRSAAGVSKYVSVRLAEDVFVVAPQNVAAFERGLYEALLTGEVVLARHPAVTDGAKQETDWEEARLKTGDERLTVGTKSGSFFEVGLDDVRRVETDTRPVLDQQRTVVEVDHSVEGVTVQTHFSGPDRHCSFLRSLLGESERRTETDPDLDEAQREVLTALYSGVSPFDIPEFVGVDEDRVEDIFERLIERDILEEVRVRREVALTDRGRNLASETINEE